MSNFDDFKKGPGSVGGWKTDTFDRGPLKVTNQFWGKYYPSGSLGYVHSRVQVTNTGNNTLHNVKVLSSMDDDSANWDAVSVNSDGREITPDPMVIGTLAPGETSTEHSYFWSIRPFGKDTTANFTADINLLASYDEMIDHSAFTSTAGIKHPDEVQGEYRDWRGITYKFNVGATDWTTDHFNYEGVEIQNSYASVVSEETTCCVGTLSVVNQGSQVAHEVTVKLGLDDDSPTFEARLCDKDGNPLSGDNTLRFGPLNPGDSSPSQSYYWGVRDLEKGLAPDFQAKIRLYSTLTRTGLEVPPCTSKVSVDPM